MTIGIIEKEHLTIILGRGDMFLFVTKFNRKKVVLKDAKINNLNLQFSTRNLGKI